MTTSEKFFYNNAGYSYDPKIETKEQGRVKCAKALAAAEKEASGMVSFAWRQDYESGDEPLWVCMAISEETGELLASLCGIDLGDETPYHYAVGLLGDPVRFHRHAECRVVEAELAIEALK